MAPHGCWESAGGSTRRGQIAQAAAPDFAPPFFLLLEEPDGTLWADTAVGLAAFRHGRVETTGPIPQFEGAPILTVMRTRDDRLWIGTSRGIATLQQGRFTTMARSALIGDDPVSVMVEDRHGAVWAGTTRSGLLRFAGGKAERYQQKDGLLSNQVFAIREDREGNILVGTHGGGVEVFSEVSFTSFGAAEGFGNSYARPMLEARDGTIWIGYQQGGLRRMSAGSVTSFGVRDGVPEAPIMSLAETGDGVIWIGTDGAGVLRFQDGRFEPLKPAHGSPGTRVRFIGQVPDGTVWITSRDSPLTLFRNGRVVQGGDARIGPYVNAIAEASDGAIWIGTSSGLQRLHEGRVDTFTVAQGVPDMSVRTLYADANGDVWIGSTGAGLLRYRRGRFHRYTTATGLYSDVMFSITDDLRGQLWFTCNQGVYSVDKAAFDALDAGKRRRITSRHYGPVDGTRALEFNGGFPPSMRDRNGRLWFPTMAGITSVDPARLSTNTTAPIAIVEAVAVDGVPLSPRGTLRVGPGRGKIEFRYTAVSMGAAGRLTFRYQLVGFDDNWIEAGATRTATYTNIPPGAYTFRVSAAHREGRGSAADAAVALHLAPHLHQTWAFFGLCGLGVAIGTVACTGGGCDTCARARHSSKD